MNERASEQALGLGVENNPVGLAGNPLRALREQAGLPLATLAAMLKVAPQKLEALEAGRYQDLPDLTFARALAKSVCRVLKVDPAPVLAALPQAQAVAMPNVNEGLNTPFPTRGGGSVSAPGRGQSMPKVPRTGLLAMAVLLLAGLLWFVLPENMNPMQVAPSTSEVNTPTEPAPEPVLPVSPNLNEVPAPVPSATPLSPAAVVESPQSQAVAEGAPEAVNPPVPAASESRTDALSLRARETTWVQVTGASGRLLLQRNLQAGESVTFNSDLPLAVVVGRADATEVLVRGAAFDVTPYVRNQVARFEVK